MDEVEAALMGAGYFAGMKNEIDPNSEVESPSQTLLRPLYLGALAGVVLGGVFVASILFI